MIRLGSHSSESIGDNSFLPRAILYGGIGLLFGLRGSKLANLAFLGPVTEVALGFKIEKALYEVAKQQQEKRWQKRAEEIYTKLGGLYEASFFEPK